MSVCDPHLNASRRPVSSFPWKRGSKHSPGAVGSFNRNKHYLINGFKHGVLKYSIFGSSGELISSTFGICFLFLFFYNSSWPRSSLTFVSELLNVLSIISPHTEVLLHLVRSSAGLAPDVEAEGPSTNHCLNDTGYSTAIASVPLCPVGLGYLSINIFSYNGDEKPLIFFIFLKKNMEHDHVILKLKFLKFSSNN